MKAGVFALFAVLWIVTQAGAQEQSGSVRGTVVDSVTHQPLGRAKVSLEAAGNPKPTVTDASGAFVFDSIGPGEYQIAARHRNYPQPRSGPERKRVVVLAGKETEPITLELVPGASVSGHILDVDGDPLERCNLRIRASGEEIPRGALPLGTLVDQGAYRLFNLLPGKYILIALCPTAVFQPRPLSADPDLPPSTAYPKQTYPEVLNLLPGVERTGVDFKMEPAPVTSIDVTLAPGVEWRGRRDLAWSLVSLDPFDSNLFGGGWSTVNTTTGAVHIDKVFAGSYVLLLSTGIPGPAPRERLPMLGAALKMEVKTSPVKALLQVRPDIEINGSVVFENPSAANNPPLNGIQAVLTPDYPVGFLPGLLAPAKVKEDGTFQLASVFPGLVRLQVSAPHAFVKSAWIGDTELIDGKIDISAVTSGALRIILSSNTATIHGTASAGTTVALTTTAPSLFESKRSVRADQNGQFTFEGLAPGKYRLMTESPGKLAEDDGMEIVLREGETVATEVKQEK